MPHDWTFQTIKYSGHAIKQMLTRGISADEVAHVLCEGEIAAEYPDDTPFPSRLLSGRVSNRQIHVVVGYNKEEAVGVIITAYEPNIHLWDANFKTRKPR